MSLVSIIIILVVVGALLYVVNQFVPVDAKVKKILNIVVVVLVGIWLLGVFFHGWSGLTNIRVR